MMASMGNTMTETGDMSGAVARTVDNAASGAHKAIDNASDAVRPAIDQIAAGAHQAVDRLAGAAARAADTIDVKGVQLRDAQSRFTDSCRVRVREQPIASLGIAVAAGFLLSWLLIRR
jgi:ElaB/YqjD/DUF883 family membrane-anchored ribosome-binding protein